MGILNRNSDCLNQGFAMPIEPTGIDSGAVETWSSVVYKINQVLRADSRLFMLGDLGIYELSAALANAIFPRGDTPAHRLEPKSAVLHRLCDALKSCGHFPTWQDEHIRELASALTRPLCLPSSAAKGLARIALSASVLIKALRDGWRVTAGLPQDTEYRWAWYEPERQIFWVVCASESFPEVSEGQTIPEVNPAIRPLKEDRCPHS